MVPYLIPVLFQILAGICAGVVGGAQADCCPRIPAGQQPCTAGCLKLSNSAVDTEEQHQLLEQLQNLCQTTLVEFWECINNSAIVTSDALKWEGRVCCGLAWSSSCTNACQRARSELDLVGECGDEGTTFFYCINRQEKSRTCCRRSGSSQCQTICRRLFIHDSPPTPDDMATLTQYCEPRVTTCVRNSRGVFVEEQRTEDVMQCCHQSSHSDTCRIACENALINYTPHEAINIINDTCHLTLMSPLVMCFFQHSSKIVVSHYPHYSMDLVGMDVAKRHCCHRAQSARCQEMCYETFGKSFTVTWEQFTQCEYDVTETELNTCLQQVEQPCQVGCNGLTYCSNFNHRHTELFQRCDPVADREAQATFNVWSKGNISLPMTSDIPVKDIQSCHPDWWMAIACTLHIKPCQVTPSDLLTKICYQDCLVILSDCLDTSHLQYKQTPESICRMLAPAASDQPCISLNLYLGNSHTDVSLSANSPCQNNPCLEGLVCIPRPHRCRNLLDPACQPYSCVPGCRLGELSSNLIAQGSLAQLSPMSNDKVGCHQVCTCGKNGKLQPCRDTGCLERRKCNLMHGRIEDHLKSFSLDCNDCVCYNGDWTCTNRTCHSSSGLPCNCPNWFQPVCGKNGQTYPSICVAICFGLRPSDLASSNSGCDLLDPCNPHKCATDELCVPRRQTCLLQDDTKCQQYVCVKRACSGGRFTDIDFDPVCDRMGQEHDNICYLMNHTKVFDYWGLCLANCSQHPVVCGMDTYTYPNPCAAKVALVPVQHQGVCQQSPSLNGAGRCANVRCPVLECQRWCQEPIYLTGACCPFCGAEVRALYRKELLQGLSELSSAQSSTLSIQRIVVSVKQLIAAVHCDIRAYLTLEGDLTITVTAESLMPSYVQFQSCLRQAERLTSLINAQSPLLTSQAILSPLLSAKLRLPKTVCINDASSGNNSGCHSQCHMTSGSVLVVLVVLILTHYRALET